MVFLNNLFYVKTFEIFKEKVVFLIKFSDIFAIQIIKFGQPFDKSCYLYNYLYIRTYIYVCPISIIKQKFTKKH